MGDEPRFKLDVDKSIKGRKALAVLDVSATSIPRGVILLLFAISKNTVEAAGAAS